jgi:hypothetical protein
MINGIWATKQQLESEENLYNGMQEAQYSGYPNQSATQPPIHDGRIVQRPANGHIIVISHGHENNHFYPTKDVFCKTLHHASFKGDGLLREGVQNHLCYDDRREAGIKKGQKNQEETHGGTQQCRTAYHGHYDEYVSSDCGNVDKQK